MDSMLRVEGEGEVGGLSVLGELPKNEANGIGSRGVGLDVVPGRGGNGGFGAGTGLGGSESVDVYSPNAKVGKPVFTGGNGGSWSVALGTVDLKTRVSLKMLRTQINHQVDGQHYPSTVPQSPESVTICVPSNSTTWSLTTSAVSFSLLAGSDGSNSVALLASAAQTSRRSSSAPTTRSKIAQPIVPVSRPTPCAAALRCIICNLLVASAPGACCGLGGGCTVVPVTVDVGVGRWRGV